MELEINSPERDHESIFKYDAATYEDDESCHSLFKISSNPESYSEFS
jgi:hypothetical protein